MLDLPNALACQADALTDLFQRQRIVPFQPVAELEDFCGAGVDIALGSGGGGETVAGVIVAGGAFPDPS